MEMVCRERALRWKKTELAVVLQLYTSQPNEILFESLTSRATTLMGMELHFPGAFRAESFLEKDPAPEEPAEEGASDEELLERLDNQIPDID